MGSVGFRRDGRECRRHHVRLLRLPHRAGGFGFARPHHTRELVGPGADDRRAVRRVAGAGHRYLGRRHAPSPNGTRRVHRLGRRDDVGDEPDPRGLPLSVAGPGPAGVHRSVQRSGDGALQRHVEAAFDGGELGPDLRTRFGRRIFRQCAIAADPLSRIHPRRWRHPRPPGPRGGRRPARAGGDVACRGVVRSVRATAIGFTANPGPRRASPAQSGSSALIARSGTR